MWVASPLVGALAYQSDRHQHRSLTSPYAKGDIGNGANRDFNGLRDPFGFSTYADVHHARAAPEPRIAGTGRSHRTRPELCAADERDDPGRAAAPDPAGDQRAGTGRCGHGRRRQPARRVAHGLQRRAVLAPRRAGGVLDRRRHGGSRCLRGAAEGWHRRRGSRRRCSRDSSIPTRSIGRRVESVLGRPLLHRRETGRPSIASASHCGSSSPGRPARGGRSMASPSSASGR